MKGLLLSLVVFFLLIVASFFSIRAYRGKKYFRVFLVEFPIAVFLYFFLFRVLPPDLTFLPPSLREPSAVVDGFAGFLLLCLLFHIFWDACYAAILTGFASELLARLYRHRVRGLSKEEFMEGFGLHEKIDHVLAWRLPNLLNGRYIQAEGDHFRLLPKGKRIAQSAIFLKRLFNMEEGG